MSVTSGLKPLQILGLLLVLPLCGAAGEDSIDLLPGVVPSNTAPAAFPLHEGVHYKVKCLGITCGHLNLSSTLEEFNGRPAYHIVMKAKNSNFFNRIYKVDARIDSWVDAQTLSTLVYESVITEKGKTSSEHFELDREAGLIRSVEKGIEKEVEFTSAEPVLDPLAFVFRLQHLAEPGGGKISLTIMTDKGPVQTISTVRGPETRRTSRGRLQLLEIEPHPADGKMFSKKGRFSMWIDPEGPVKLYILDFKLSFGHLIAKID